MSDYHILKQARDKKTINVVFHISIPAGGTNQANISWHDAIVLDLGGAAAIVSVLPELVGSQEETDMKAGTLVEVPDTVRFSSINLNNDQRKAEIAARYSEVSSTLISEKQQELAFIGFSADVP